MKKELKKYLAFLEEDELRAEIEMLVQRFPAVKDYYTLELGEGTAKVLEKYKKAMRKTIFTGRRRMNRRGRSESKKVLKDFAKIATSKKDIVELTFHRVGLLIEASTEYWIANESFSNTLLKDFDQACQLAQDEMLLDYFRQTALDLNWAHGESQAYYHDGFRMICRRYFGEG